MKNGALIFRNEDLDPQRSRPEFAEAMMEDLRWLGISWDEGPDVGGPYAPYVQSKRREVYLQMWCALKRLGAIYPCTCSRRDLAEAAQAPHELASPADPNDEPMYSGRCRQRQSDATEPGGVAWRFRVPEGRSISFADLAVGPQTFEGGVDFGDFVVWRRDDVPAYQLAVVADDISMAVTEVVRGADLLKSTARQLLLFEAMERKAPAVYHCPLLTDAGGNRLAKRHNSLSLRHLRGLGRTPEQVRALWASGPLPD